jgi:hypothetical protein
VTEYLSSQWFEQADADLARLPVLADGVTIAVRVTGGGRRPDVAYRLVLGPDRVRMISDDYPGDVRLTMSYEISAAIARGELGAQRAFLDGKIQLGGDTTALLGHQRQLAEIDDQLADLRARTRF